MSKKLAVKFAEEAAHLAATHAVMSSLDVHSFASEVVISVALTEVRKPLTKAACNAVDAAIRNWPESPRVQGPDGRWVAIPRQKLWMYV